MHDTTTTLATFAATWAIVHAGHGVADHVCQTDWQAAHKTAPTPGEVAAGASPHRGWRAALAHVATYHLTLIALGSLAWLVLPLHWTPAGIITALVWSALTHAIVDRRWPARRLLHHIRSPRFAELASGGMHGIYLADQAIHHLALLVAAVMLTIIQ